MEAPGVGAENSRRISIRKKLPLENCRWANNYRRKSKLVNAGRIIEFRPHQLIKAGDDAAGF
jgi:hypothetical protein